MDFCLWIWSRAMPHITHIQISLIECVRERVTKFKKSFIISSSIMPKTIKLLFTSNNDMLHLRFFPSHSFFFFCSCSVGVAFIVLLLFFSLALSLFLGLILSWARAYLFFPFFCRFSYSHRRFLVCQ